MVEEQIVRRQITSEAVLSAMRTVPRHQFVPEDLRAEAYEDRALPLGPRQSISQPYIVALMTELSAPRPGDRVLEIGTGSGYQAAVLAELAEAVYTVELDPELAARAAERLATLRYRNVHCRCGDGRKGWPEAAPFGAIVVTACAEEVPSILVDQLAVGGRLVLPSGSAAGDQVLRVLTKKRDGQLQRRDVIPVRFVPLD
jgi:protein-L-isoaspartate(D-aspartate) O-methyltransferase